MLGVLSQAPISFTAYEALSALSTNFKPCEATLPSSVQSVQISSAGFSKSSGVIIGGTTGVLDDELSDELSETSSEELSKELSSSGTIDELSSSGDEAELSFVVSSDELSKELSDELSEEDSLGKAETDEELIELSVEELFTLSPPHAEKELVAMQKQASKAIKDFLGLDIAKLLI